jgi:transcriptional regulator with XRE-family HTH domain
MAKRVRLKADLTAIGLRIREIRGEIFQEELAKYLGISQGQLSKLERGKLAPTAEVLVRLVERFGKTSDWILKGS